MKKLILFAALATLIAGCQTTREVIRPAQTNYVDLTVTNTLPVVGRTEVVSTVLNPVPGGPELRVTNYTTVTNIVTEVVTNRVQIITPEVAYNKVALDPTAQVVGSIGASAAPGPWGAGISLGLTVFASVLAGISERRRRKAVGENETLATVADTLVQNVEQVRSAALKFPEYQKIDGKVLRAIEDLQRIAGVKTEIHNLVEEKTETTIPVV